MANITLFDKKGKKSSKNQEINSDLFGLEPNKHLLYLAVVRQEANARAGTAHTKTRPEVRGGGAKPWKQKGTGRARAGSSNSPLWNGGGVIFGPRNNVNWTKGMNKKESARAIVSALNTVNNDSRFFAIEELILDEAKTKAMSNLVQETGFAGKKVLFVADSENNQLALLKRASRNLVNTKVISTTELNVKDILKADVIIASSKAINEIEERFAEVAESAKEKLAAA
jgi:large subunit ribosomal protein L4